MPAGSLALQAYRDYSIHANYCAKDTARRWKGLMVLHIVIVN